MNSKALAIVLGVILIIGAIAFVLLGNKTQRDVASIMTFQECKDAGYPIMESYPEQCATPDGRTFINDTQVPPTSNPDPNQTSNDPGTNGSIIANGCAVAGCSAQLCVSAEEAANIVTTCEYRAEYACYRQALCEPQANGKCGWTQTAELTACLQNPPPLDESENPVF